MDEMDEEQADAIEEAFDHDYDVAQSFRKHIVPKGKIDSIHMQLLSLSIMY